MRMPVCEVTALGEEFQKHSAHVSQNGGVVMFPHPLCALSVSSLSFGDQNCTGSSGFRQWHSDLLALFCSPELPVPHTWCVLWHLLSMEGAPGRATLRIQLLSHSGRSLFLWMLLGVSFHYLCPLNFIGHFDPTSWFMSYILWNPSCSSLNCSISFSSFSPSSSTSPGESCFPLWLLLTSHNSNRK